MFVENIVKTLNVAPKIYKAKLSNCIRTTVLRTKAASNVVIDLE